MKTAIYNIIASILILTIGCNNPQDNNATKTSKDEINLSKDSINTITVDTKNSYQRISLNIKAIENPIIISDSVKFYLQPDTTSEVLSILKFNTNLTLIEKGWANQITWYNVLINGIKGYIVSDDIATQSYKNKEFIYCLVTDISKKHNPTENGTTIYKYDTIKNKTTDTLTLIYNSGHSGISRISNYGWKNVDFLLRISSYSGECGGGGTNQFIIDANNKLSILIESGYWGDDGDNNGFTDVWFPVKLDRTEKVVLVKDGDTTRLSDIYPGEMKLYKYPKKLNIPISELIVERVVESQPVLNSEGKALEIDGSFKYKTIKDIVKYYRWNGQKLLKVE